MKRCLFMLSLCLCCMLAACGGSGASSTAASPTATAPTTINPNVTTPASSGGAPNVLLVTRTDPSATDNIGELNKTVTNATTVQNLYTMAHKLPPYPVGSSISQSCLNDLGVIYHLDFRQDGTEVQRMNLDPGNCKILYLSQTDLRQASDTFLNLLKQALGVSSLTSNE